ncbi:MAG: dihydroorotate dehydrogenase-like protein [Chloroflexota bacterium]
MSVDLTTRYLGLELRSPLVASASPLTRDADYARRLEDAGVGAIVLPSLFEEEILHEELGLDRALDVGAEQFAEALDFFPEVREMRGVGDRYVRDLERVRHGATVPIVASLNATTTGGWVRYARRLQDAGADALELNVYHVAADPRRDGDDVEQADLELIAAVRDAVSIPLAVKLSPYYTSFASFARSVALIGVDGLVLLNRFYQPDLDLETLDIVPKVELSRSWELRMPLRWIAILRPQLAPGFSIAATSGIESGTDALKALLVGANVAMMTSALLRHGPAHVAVVEQELRAWMERQEYVAVAQLTGSVSQASVEDPSAFERANYRATLHSWTTPRHLEPAPI